MTDETKKGIGDDGVLRTVAAERALNDLFAAAFANPGAQEALAYLKSITINAVSGPKISDGELRHLEGQRYIVGLIERRIDHGRRKQPRLSGE